MGRLRATVADRKILRVEPLIRTGPKARARPLRKKTGEMIHIDIKKSGRIEGTSDRIVGERTGQS